MGAPKYTLRSNKDPLDHYVTPVSMVEQFISARGVFSDPILDPCAGTGNVSRGIKKVIPHAEVIERDITTGEGFFSTVDSFPSIITNPPWRKHIDWIKQCKKVAEVEFALLLPLDYLHGHRRHKEIWSDRNYRLSEVYIFTRKPMLNTFVDKDNMTYNTGMTCYAWFVWENDGYLWNPEIYWIDNNRFVRRKK